MEERYHIRLAGLGGQGIGLAGLVLAEAAVRDGKNVLHTQYFGAQTRGGASVSEVIIADSEINYPRLVKADVLLAMDPDGYDKYACDLALDGLLLVDSLAEKISPNRCSFPITALARNATGNSATATIVGLGMMAGLTALVSREAIIGAIAARAPEHSQKINNAAVLAGLQASERMIISRPDLTLRRFGRVLPAGR